MEGRTPAQVYSLVFGATLLLAGILGFFYSSAFGTPGETDAVLGIFEVNGWHNIVHLLSGVAGLALAGSAAGARTFALGFGIVYLAVTIWGFAVGDGGEILGFLPVNTEDNFLHLAISLAGIAAGLLSSDRSEARTATT